MDRYEEAAGFVLSGACVSVRALHLTMSPLFTCEQPGRGPEG